MDPNADSAVGVASVTAAVVIEHGGKELVVQRVVGITAPNPDCPPR